MKNFLKKIVPRPVWEVAQYCRLRRDAARFRKRVVEHCYGGRNFRVELADSLAQAWYDVDWPILPEIRLLQSSQLKAGATVFDIGAHQGIVAMMLAAGVERTGKVILVEPNPHNVRQCRRNIELNAFDNMFVIHAAASDEPGKLEFNRGFNGAAADVSRYGGVSQVEALTVNDLVNAFGQPQVVFVDVEGYECNVLAGAGSAFAHAPDWFVEVHVNAGLERAGGSVATVLAQFDRSLYDLYVHRENDASVIPIDDAEPGLFSDRFFLTAIGRHGCLNRH